MSIIKESLLWNFFISIYALAQQSGIAGLCNRVSIKIKKLWAGSAVSVILSRQGKLATDWDNSFAYRLLTGLANFVPGLLGKLYARYSDLWDRSIIMRAIWYCGEHAYIFISWLFLFVLIIPYEKWNNFYSFAGLIMILLLFYVYAMKKNNVGLELRSVGVYAVAFVAFEVLFVFLSIDKSESLRYFVYHFTCILAVLLIVNSVRTTKQLLHIIDFSLVGTAIASIYALVQRLQGIEINKSFVDLSVNANMPGRVYSFFLNPNSFAMLLIMMLPVSATLTIYSKGYKRLFYAFVFVISTVALLMTYTRAAWAGYALSILVLALIMRPILVPIFMLLGVFALPLLPDSIYNRIMTIFNSNDTSISSRKPIYDAVWRLILKNPVFGAGLGTDTAKTAVMKGSFYYGTSPYVHAHSIYLQIAAELGIFGLLAFLGTIVSGIKNGLKSILGKRGSRLLQAIIAAQISAFAGIMLCSLADYPWSFPRVMLIFWFAFAILISAIKLANQSNPD